MPSNLSLSDTHIAEIRQSILNMIDGLKESATTTSTTSDPQGNAFWNALNSAKSSFLASLDTLREAVGLHTMGNFHDSVGLARDNVSRLEDMMLGDPNIAPAFEPILSGFTALKAVNYFSVMDEYVEEILLKLAMPSIENTLKLKYAQNIPMRGQWTQNPVYAQIEAIRSIAQERLNMLSQARRERQKMIGKAWEQHRNSQNIDAIRAFDEVLAIKADDVDALYGKGLAQRASGDKSGAVKSFQLAYDYVTRTTAALQKARIIEDGTNSLKTTEDDRYMMLARMCRQRLHELNAEASA
jgi:tetratricopeptide (TPR) repeat protein